LKRGVTKRHFKLWMTTSTNLVTYMAILKTDLGLIKVLDVIVKDDGYAHFF